jgi:hypothetical protein
LSWEYEQSAEFWLDSWDASPHRIAEKPDKNYVQKVTRIIRQVQRGSLPESLGRSY